MTLLRLPEAIRISKTRCSELREQWHTGEKEHPLAHAQTTTSMDASAQHNKCTRPRLVPPICCKEGESCAWHDVGASANITMALITDVMHMLVTNLLDGGLPCNYMKASQRAQRASLYNCSSTWPNAALFFTCMHQLWTSCDQAVAELHTWIVARTKLAMQVMMWNAAITKTRMWMSCKASAEMTGTCRYLQGSQRIEVEHEHHRCCCMQTLTNLGSFAAGRGT